MSADPLRPRAAAYLRWRERRARRVTASIARSDWVWARLIARTRRPRSVTRLAGSFLRYDGLVQGARHRSAVVQEALWLGLLDAEDIDDIDRAHYATSPIEVGQQRFDYRDGEFARLGLADWEASAITTALPPTARVTVLGAGIGREILALLKGGYAASGHDPDAELVRIGETVLAAEGWPGRLAHAAAETAHAADAAIVGWNRYSRIMGRDSRIALLRAAGAGLPPGGPVLLSFWTRSDDGRLARLCFGLTAAVRHVRWAPAPERGDVLQPQFAHRFTAGEIEGEIEAAGLRLVHHHGGAQGWAIAERR